MVEDDYESVLTKMRLSNGDLFPLPIVLDVNKEFSNQLDIGEKILLCDVQNEIYPELEKVFLNVLHGSGFPELKFNKKINFDELYKNNQN